MAVAQRPRLTDVIRIVRAMSRGSAVDAPRSLLTTVFQLTRMTPPDSPKSMTEVEASEVYGDLSTPKLAVGDLAYAFELPKLDLTSGLRRDTGETVGIADYRGVQPVALIFGSYT